MTVRPAPSLRRLASDASVLPESTSPDGQKRVILEAALRLFAERNFAGASVRDIAAIVGIKPASLYAHFKSKEDMLALLVEIGHREHHDRIARAVAESAEDPQSQLQSWVIAHVQFHAEYPMLATAINHELHALPSERIADSLLLREQTVQILTGILEAGEKRRAFSVGHDLWLAAAAIGAMGMRVAHWFNSEQPHSVADTVAAYTDFALRAVGAKSTQE